MPRSIRVAAVQLDAHDRAGFPRALPAILARASEAAARAQLVVLPEATLPAYVLERASNDDLAAVASAIEELRAIAARTQTVVVCGAAVYDGRQARNRAIVIDADGSLAGGADKFFLWHFDRRWFAAGERIAPIPTAAGTLGVLVCADGRIPTIARALVDRGAEILVMPTAWVTSGRDPERLENAQADLLARVRAYENGVPFVAANKCGAELGIVAYCGKSQIVAADGTPVAVAAERRPEILDAGIVIGAQPKRVEIPAGITPARNAAEALRLAIAFEPLRGDDASRLALLDDDHAIVRGDSERLARLCETVAAVAVDDAAMRDPGYLASYRRAGYRLAIWEASGDDWTERIARARALELRVYVVCFDASRRRAFAVDPDGNVVAGTFGDFRIASFPFDPRRTNETCVAPGSDVEEALDRVAALTAGKESSQA